MATNLRPQGVWEISLVNELLTGAYVDFGRRGASAYAGSREVQPGVVVDYGLGDVPIGIEFHDPGILSVELINKLLDGFELPRLSEAEYLSLGLATARGSAAGRPLVHDNAGAAPPSETDSQDPGNEAP